MNSPLDGVAFLARSENRVAVLEELASGPATRGDLRESTGVGRITLGRVLGDFDERGWVVREEHGYELTIVGELVAEAFEQVVEAMSTAERFKDVIKWVPADEMDFDLRRLSSAELYVPTSSDPFASLRRAQQGLESTDSLQLLTNATAEETLEVMARRTSTDGLPLSVVLDAETLRIITDDPSAFGHLQTILKSDGEVYRYEGQAPIIVAVLDEMVHVGVDDEAGVNAALIESVDPEVRAWAERMIETYREEATPVELADLDS